MNALPPVDLSVLPIGKLFEDASSIAPVPGGGCVSAVCGYFAISLLLKSIRVSSRAHPADTALIDIQSRLITLAAQLLLYAQADSDSFGSYMTALKLPKTTPEEITSRKSSIHEAAVGATLSALNILDAGNSVLDIAHTVQGRVAASILADERSAVALISAMNSTAEWNADANTASMSGEGGIIARLALAKLTHATLLSACQAGEAQ